MLASLKMTTLVKRLFSEVNATQYVSVRVCTQFGHISFTARSTGFAQEIFQICKDKKYVDSCRIFQIYVNVILNKEVIPLLKDILALRPLSDRTIIIEHTSMTPCYPINLSTARSLVIGEFLRRAASLLGANASGHYWVETEAHQLKKVIINFRHENLSYYGKADWVVYRPLLNSLLINYNTRPINNSDIRAIANAHKITALQSCARDINLDYSMDIFSDLPAEHYVERCAQYYAYLAKIADYIISVVPLSQKVSLEAAKRKALNSMSKDKNVDLIYYNKLKISGEFESISQRHFFPLDSLSPQQLSEFVKLMLRTTPSKLCCVELPLPPSSFGDRRINDALDNEICIALLLCDLVQRLLDFLRSGNYCSVLPVYIEIRQRLLKNTVRIDPWILRYANICLTLLRW